MSDISTPFRKDAADSLKRAMIVLKAKFSYLRDNTLIPEAKAISVLSTIRDQVEIINDNRDPWDDNGVQRGVYGAVDFINSDMPENQHIPLTDVMKKVDPVEWVVDVREAFELFETEYPNFEMAMRAKFPHRFDENGAIIEAPVDITNISNIASTMAELSKLDVSEK